jgi:hydroxyacylglutathione hydrolase
MRGDSVMVKIISIDTPSIGDRSYLVHDGETALVIDPQRDIDRVLELAGELGVSVRDVFETHVHNDYVTGGLALARATGATYHLNGADPASFERHPIVDGDVVEVSASMSVRAVATPGHTFNHLSYVLLVGGAPLGVFSGGSLLYGSTGRTDLLGTDVTELLAHAQYHSAQHLAQELADETPIFPTHGFGSFCSASETVGDMSTIGAEKRANPALTQSEDRFVCELLAGLDAYPAYYAHMGAANLAAPDSPPDLSPVRRADPVELQARIDAGEWVVDLRNRTAFTDGHMAGTLNFGLDGSFATYLGWLIPWGTPLSLLGESPEQILEAQRELVRIGIDRPVAGVDGAPEQWAGAAGLQSFEISDFAGLAAARSHADILVLDVRRNLEWTDEHITGALHIPLHELVERMGEIPPGRIWVHCQTGYRASIAASLLGAAGRDVVLIDD